MYEALKAALRVTGLMTMALFIAHCGDSDVRVVTGDGVSPAAGTFAGSTGEGGSITIEVGSIESVTFDCEDEVISEIFSPPRQVNSDGTFSVSFDDAGREFNLNGRFTDNNNGEGTIEDHDNECDTTFDVARQGVVPATRTATPSGPVPTLTPGGPPTVTSTPAPGEPTLTPVGPTFTPGGGVPTPTVTATPGTAGGCPIAFDFEGTAGTAPVLDAGWTGQGHDAQVISEGKLTFNVNCTATAPPCGQCPISGPIPNRNGANYTAMTGSDINPQRCSNDTSTVCTSNAECSGGTCSFYFGTYLPLAAGGVSTCVGNRITGAVSGTVNVEAGSGSADINLISQVFSGPTLDQPCPNCTGDPTANDGKREGTCAGSGARTGMPCDINGASPNVFFGATSLDCPPLSGGVIANLPIDLTSTTGSLSRSLTAESPNCRAPGFTTEKCHCDTCATQAAEPCASNADCPGGAVCGGRRCVGGAKAGTPCAQNSECPGGACSVPGAATKPHDCTTDPTCPGDGLCTDPVAQFCQPTAPHKGCDNDGECPAGNTCQIKFRPCFTATATAQGQADPPSGGESDPTIAAMFCIGPTSSSAVNAAAGLPGLGRVEIPGHATQIF